MPLNLKGSARRPLETPKWKSWRTRALIHTPKMEVTIRTKRLPAAGVPTGPVLCFLAAAGVTKAIGIEMMSDTTLRSGRSGGAFEIYELSSRLNRNTNIEATTDIVAVICAFVGIILLFRAAMSRLRSKSQSV
jgi:hypothetical protein